MTTTDEALVERVARAINNATCGFNNHPDDDKWKLWVGEARAAIAAMSPAPQWRTIDSAPRDGQVIDVWRDTGGRATVYWGMPLHTCGEMGQNCDSDWHRIKTPGWVCSTFGEFLGGRHNPFTHWMPLPTPPAGAEQ